MKQCKVWLTNHRYLDMQDIKERPNTMTAYVLAYEEEIS